MPPAVKLLFTAIFWYTRNFIKKYYYVTVYVMKMYNTQEANLKIFIIPVTIFFTKPGDVSAFTRFLPRHDFLVKNMSVGTYLLNNHKS